VAFGLDLLPLQPARCPSICTASGRELSAQHRIESQAVISAFSHQVRAQMHMNMPPAPTVLPVDQARQGVTGHNVRYVLGFGIAGAVISFIIVGFLFGALW
jgi:hypothetical protein